MSDLYLENTADILDSIKRRESFVQEELDRIGPTCSKTPMVPCCLLRTELEILQRYSYTLEREIDYRKSMEETDHADVRDN